MDIFRPGLGFSSPYLTRVYESSQLAAADGNLLFAISSVCFFGRESAVADS
ncbi:hypothetical protein ES703_21053 [subsurface metagenome]